MNKVFRKVVFAAGALLVMAGNASASTIDYEKVELFSAETYFTETFEIPAAGNYLATLTDFGFPAPMTDTGLSITTATELLGSLMAPGTLTFYAMPGQYYVGFFGMADLTTPSQLGQYGIEISQVSIPASIWLFGSGLLGLVGVSRRRKA